MIAEANPLITTAAVAIVVVGSSLLGRDRQAAAPTPLSGVLYSITSDTQAAHTAANSMPLVDNGLHPAARATLPPSSAPTLAHRIHEDSNRKAAALGSPSAVTPSKRRRKHPEVKAAEVVVPIATAATLPTPTTPLVVAQPTAPKPTFPPTFAEIDDALRASSTVQAINFRVKKGGVTFRLTQVGRIGERYVIRYAIANEEPGPFFLSIVNVAAGDKPIQSETAGTYSCPTRQEVYGVVHFRPSAVAGKTVVVELVQSGGEHRRFTLSADYAF